MSRSDTARRVDRRYFIDSEFEALECLAAATRKDMAETMLVVADLMAVSVKSGGQVLFCGNGGSAADAQHMAAEFVVRLDRDRPGMRARALTTDPSVLTAVSNDLGYENVFARQIEVLARPEDLLVLISTSGESPNLTRAAEAARKIPIPAIALLGKGGGDLARAVDHALIVPSRRTAHIQELHCAMGHILCALVEQTVFGPCPEAPGNR
ncbi:MAG: SIS domain-containing protein [Candidatus Eisenbacteria sp.]|nr:SIS domain-containing protein [Candidatus Eisenbacteria bacterium]